MRAFFRPSPQSCFFRTKEWRTSSIQRMYFSPIFGRGRFWNGSPSRILLASWYMVVFCLKIVGASKPTPTIWFIVLSLSLYINKNVFVYTRTFKRSSFWFLKMRFLKGRQKDTPLNNHMWQINKTDLSCNGRTISKYLKSTNVKRVPIPNRRENLSSWATTTKGVETLTHDANLITRDGLGDLVGWSWHFLEWHYQSENAQSCLKWTTWYQNRH